MPKLKPDTVWPSDEEETEINAHAQADRTLHSDEELTQFVRLDSAAVQEKPLTYG